MSADLRARYDGKPMLRLLDGYVLDALGALDEATAANLAGMQPKISASLGVEATTWQDAVERSVAMPPDSAEALRLMWERHVHEIVGAGGTPEVLEWAHDLVDSRFNQG